MTVQQIFPDVQPFAVLIKEPSKNFFWNTQLQSYLACKQQRQEDPREDEVLASLCAGGCLCSSFQQELLNAKPVLLPETADFAQRQGRMFSLPPT